MKENRVEQMHRLLAGLLACSVAFACACSKNEETEKSKKDRKATQSEETEEPETETTAKPTFTPTPSPSPSPSPSPTPTPVPGTFDEASAQSYMDGITFDGVVLVAENDQISWTYESGLADRDNNVPNTMDTVFEFGSITKQFTAVAIMQLVEQGKISLEDTLDKYIPDYPYADKITIHQLLNMTSGVPDYLFCGVLGFSWSDFENLDFSTIMNLESLLGEVATTPLKKEELVEKISKYPLNFDPGTQYEYSNTNYYFLGIIIEQLSGMAYDEYIRKNILEPLDLTELFPDNDHLTSNGRTDLKLIHFDFPHQDVTLSYSVGVMTGTAEGLLEWEKCVLDRKLLSSESWDKIFDGGQFGYGYGWTIVGDGVVEHSGMTLGYNTNVRINLKDRKVIIVLSNIQPLSGSKSRPLSSEIGDKLWGMF